MKLWKTGWNCFSRETNGLHTTTKGKGKPTDVFDATSPLIAGRRHQWKHHKRRRTGNTWMKPRCRYKRLFDLFRIGLRLLAKSFYIWQKDKVWCRHVLILLQKTNNNSRLLNLNQLAGLTSRHFSTPSLHHALFLGPGWPLIGSLQWPHTTG